MSDKFQNKYRIPSARLQNWDYGSNALYFVTICTAHRECYFGKIVNGKMILSEIGNIANQFWFEIPIHFPFVVLDEFVVMPNHVHGIIVINKPNNGRNNEMPFIELSRNETPRNEMAPYEMPINETTIVETPKLGVSTIPTNEPIPTNKSITTNEHIPIAAASQYRQRTIAASEKWNPETLGVILNQYKRICTIHARKIHAGFAWQSRFHDHIIRNDESFQRISYYIANNPSKWADDKFYNEL